MATRVYGQSDDLIEFEGDISDEVGHWEPDDDAERRGTLITFSDGTVIQVRYGKAQQGIWELTTVRKGDLFDRIDVCEDEDADPYSDVAHFRDGLKWAYAAKNWERVR